MDFKHFVTFSRANGNDVKSDTRQVHSNEISQIFIPEGTDIIVTFDEADKDVYKNGEKIISKYDRLNEKTYYIGEIKSLDDIKAQEGEESACYKKLIKNNCIGAVITNSNVIIPVPQNPSINIISPLYIGCYGPNYQELEPEM